MRPFDHSRWRWRPDLALLMEGNMRFHKTASLCCVFVLAFVQAARAEFDENDHFDQEDGDVRDVGPEMGVLFNPFLFRGPGEVLGNSNRGGTFTTRNRGERWRRSMRGLLNSAGVEAFDFITCQARSARSV